MSTCCSKTKPASRGVLWLASLVFLAAAGFYLWAEHRAHLYGALPYLLFLTCPLMHLFMHRGHGEHGEHGGRGRQQADRTQNQVEAQKTEQSNA